MRVAGLAFLQAVDLLCSDGGVGGAVLDHVGGKWL